MDNFIFSSNRYGVLLFELVQFVLLFEHIFNESSPAISHLVEAVIETALNAGIAVVDLSVTQVGQVPDVVGNEFLHSVNLNMVNKIFLEAAESFDET